MEEPGRVCSLCKQSLGSLRTIDTQTEESNSNDNSLGMAAATNFISEEDYQPSDQTKVEDQSSDEFLAEVGGGSSENKDSDFAVFREVCEETDDMDANIEVGTAAEMAHPAGSVVVLTRSFECQVTAPDARWRRAGRIAMAANRLGAARRRSRRENGLETALIHNKLVEDEAKDLHGGLRRVVINNGRYPICRRDIATSDTDVGTSSSSYADDSIKTGKHIEREVTEGVLKQTNVNKLEDISEETESNIENESKVIVKASMEKLRRASTVLGPNIKCLKLEEEHENIDPEKDIGLAEKDNLRYNVLVLTRSFECDPSSEPVKGGASRWRSLKKAAIVSRALNRMRRTSRLQQQQQASEDSNSVCIEADEHFEGNLASGYRRVSMTTIEEIVPLNERRFSFRRKKSSPARMMEKVSEDGIE
eukprot:Seg8292.1 transcript_id=Seg8292.1/GoldUCD/mRNA.D3Y31 product="hypothetical protein" protein_id=Seg8292.1/GoldUCD/D3Y31